MSNYKDRIENTCKFQDDCIDCIYNKKDCPVDEAIIDAMKKMKKEKT